MMLMDGMIVAAAFMAVVAEESAKILKIADRAAVMAAWYYCKPVWR